MRPLSILFKSYEEFTIKLHRFIKTIRHPSLSFLQPRAQLHKTKLSSEKLRLSDRLPTHPWPGKAENGHWLLNGLHQYPGGFEAAISAFWSVNDAKTRHNFSWLFDLKQANGDQARQTSRILIASWIERFEHKRVKTGRTAQTVWTPQSASMRVLWLLRTYDFHCSSANDSYQQLIFETLLTHGRYIANYLPTSRKDEDTLTSALALIYIALSTQEHLEWLELGEVRLKKYLKNHILADGGHISRSPEKLLSVLMKLLDLKQLYSVNTKQPFEGLLKYIDQTAAALKVLKHTDGGLALFHGGQEGDKGIIELALHQAQAGRSVQKTLPKTGFERLSMGRALLILDVGTAPNWPHDAQSGASPLAFELSFGKERLFVNCGTHPNSSEWPEWRDALRGTSAYTALSMDNRNAYEIRSDGHIGRKASSVQVTKNTSRTHITCQAIHDGYHAINGFQHKRVLELSQKGFCLEGFETLLSEASPATAPTKEIEVATRFHLHPRVKASLIKDDTEILLRLPSGVGWRFQNNQGTLKLEDSIYFGHGAAPIKTKQIVIYCNLTHAELNIGWQLQKEGLS